MILQFNKKWVCAQKLGGRLFYLIKIVALISIFFNPGFLQETVSTQKLKTLSPREEMNFEGISPNAKVQNLKFITLDGFRISADFYKSISKEKGTFVIVPDLHDSTFQSVKVFAKEMIQDFNIFILYPRGHINSDDYLGGKKRTSELIKNEKESMKFFRDYKAILEIFQDRKKELNIQTDKCIFVTGKFHSNLIVTEILEGVSGLVLLSTRKQFYKKSTADYIEKLNLPVLIISDKYRETELRETISTKPNSRIQMKFFSKIGVGFSVILKRPEIIGEIRNFAESIK